MTSWFSTIRVPGTDGIPNNTVVGNITGADGPCEAVTVSALLDSVFGATQGTIIFRSANGWAALPPGKKNSKLSSGGPGADPFWSGG